MAIVDPGPDDADHIDAVLAAVDGEQVEALLITHTLGITPPRPRQ